MEDKIEAKCVDGPLSGNVIKCSPSEGRILFPRRDIEAVWIPENEDLFRVGPNGEIYHRQKDGRYRCGYPSEVYMHDGNGVLTYQGRDERCIKYLE